MRDGINFILKLIKWPLALLMVVAFIPVLNADILMVERTINSKFMVAFLIPMIGMVLIWFFIPGLNGSHLSIFEHEFTHMIAALLTFHPPRSMRIEADKGGSFGYYGEGNWFITLAPYFIPTFPLLLMLASLIWLHFEPTLPDFFMPSLGMMFGYHIVSNMSQIHGDQTDFPKAGWIFSLLFLPTANLVAFAVVWAFAVNSWHGIGSWWNLVVVSFEEFVSRFF